MATLPNCGVSCVEYAFTLAASTCSYNYVCVCRSSSYIASFYSCVNEYCSAAEIENWIQDATRDCAAYGVAWPSYAPSAQSTAVAASVATSTSIATAVVVISSTLTSIAVPSSVTVSDFFGLTSSLPPNTNSLPSSTSPTNAPAIPTSPAPIPDSQSTNNGLSTGAKAGIAVGAIGVVFLAILGAFLVWRRKRNKARAPPADIGPASEHEAVGGDSYIFEKDSKTAPPTTTTTVTAIKYPPELRDELARPEPTYKGPISPVDSPQPPLSPSPAYVEAAGPVPAEIDSSTQPTSAHGHAIPHPGLAEADSTVLSHNITSPLSELEQPSLIYHELPTASPPQSPPSGLASSSSAAAYPAYAPGPLSGNPVGDAEADDPELVRMKADLEALRAEKEQVQRLQSIEAREKELSRRIVDRELGVRRESGGPS